MTSERIFKIIYATRGPQGERQLIEYRSRKTINEAAKYAYETIKLLKETFGVPVQVKTIEETGYSPAEKGQA
ncbi:MAG: hypothetical protein O7B30_05460 [Thaumarchaeota archaeon]|nr:hypothetical protein [Nitrososphaerota archaeon]